MIDRYENKSGDIRAWHIHVPHTAGGYNRPSSLAEEEVV